MDKDFQALLIERIKKRIPSHTTFEYEAAKLLGLEMEQLYDIARNRKELSINQAYQLARHYNISFDKLLKVEPNVIPFKFRAVEYDLKSMEDYFHSVLMELKSVDFFGERKLTYAANDFPVFTLFQFPVLASFKIFFWGKAAYGIEEFKDVTFSIKDIDYQNLKKGEHTWRQYLKLPSAEIWSSDIVDNALRQVKHAWNNGYIANKSDAMAICQDILDLLDHTEEQAKIGKKFHPHYAPPKRENYQLYFNKAAVTNNSIFFKSDDFSVAFVLQNTLNYLVTEHEAFCLRTEHWLNHLTHKSTLLSIHNEQQRQAIFSRWRNKVNNAIEDFS